jgi:hypothetical protein
MFPKAWRKVIARFFQQFCPMFADLCVLHSAIESMKKGEVAKFAIKPEMGYGDLGEERLEVPSAADLVYEVKLVDFKAVHNLDLYTLVIPSQSVVSYAMIPDSFWHGISILRASL